MSNALIFIPDITGFSHFVNSTPVEHSRHIISELLEIIIAANSLDLTVSEIEGDAVLFYREGPAPSQAEVLRQTREIFIAFHTHLKRYESLRICNCDACSTAQALGIKFVVHYGEIGFIEVNKIRKPHGSALITAHRLLKNHIPAREYLLLSKDYCDATPQLDHFPNWAPGLKASQEEFDIGEVRYEYLPLGALDQFVPEAPAPILPEKSAHPLIFWETIPAPLPSVFTMVADLRHRHKWNPDVAMLDVDPEKINRIGASHRCIINANEVTVETTAAPEPDRPEAQKRTFGERITQVPLVGNLSVYFFLEQVPAGTELRIEVHFPKLPLHKRILLPFLRRSFRNNFGAAAKRLRGLFQQAESAPSTTINQTVAR
ncbi:MAG: DUF2652 domain-containing protein [Bacteroidota bacterium]